MIGLVACSSKKLDRAAPAEDLYTSPLFRLSRDYVEQRCSEWGILSAKHGLLLPSQEVEPYDLALSSLPVADVYEWANRVRGQLRDRWPGEKFLVVAGRLYRGALDGMDVTAPFEGLQIGNLLQALKWKGARCR